MGLSAVMGFLRWDLKYSYGAYEKYYANELGDAFRSDNQKRKQLVYAYTNSIFQCFNTCIKNFILCFSFSSFSRNCCFICINIFSQITKQRRNSSCTCNITKI